MKNYKESGHTIMFNMTEIGRKISALRKKANLTQMELADRLDISFQAVSNWERGQTMPDISKLSELSEIFDVSIDEILQNERATKISKSLIDKDAVEENISVEELEEFAPILKPDQLNDIVEDVKKDMTISDIVKLMPFVTQEFMEDYARDAIKNVEKVSELTKIAPFISKAVLDELALEILEHKGVEGIVSLAPFLSQGLIDDSAKKVLEQSESLSGIVSLAPFISNNIMNELALEAINKHGLSGISGILPFIDTKILEDQLRK